MQSERSEGSAQRDLLIEYEFLCIRRPLPCTAGSSLKNEFPSISISFASSERNSALFKTFAVIFVLLAYHPGFMAHSQTLRYPCLGNKRFLSLKNHDYVDYLGKNLKILT